MNQDQGSVFKLREHSCTTPVPPVKFDRGGGRSSVPGPMTIKKKGRQRRGPIFFRSKKKVAKLRRGVGHKNKNFGPGSVQLCVRLDSTMVVHLDGSQEPGPGSSSGRVRKLLPNFKNSL